MIGKNKKFLFSAQFCIHICILLIIYHVCQQQLCLIQEREKCTNIHKIFLFFCKVLHHLYAKRRFLPFSLLSKIAGTVKSTVSWKLRCVLPHKIDRSFHKILNFLKRHSKMFQRMFSWAKANCLGNAISVLNSCPRNIALRYSHVTAILYDVITVEFLWLYRNVIPWPWYG